jgi:hypothetical protein
MTDTGTQQLLHRPFSAQMYTEVRGDFYVLEPELQLDRPAATRVRRAVLAGRG